MNTQNPKVAILALVCGSWVAAGCAPAGAAAKTPAPIASGPGGSVSEPPEPGPGEKSTTGLDSADQSLAAQEDSRVPDQCPSQGECLPSPAWVKKLCSGVYQDVALYMLRSGTPWQRMYLTRETDAMNASGGASVAGTLAFDEEVLILRQRGGETGGIEISGSSGNYDALRWNGSCVSLDGSEVTRTIPPEPKASRVEWKWLSDPMQAALRQDPTINETYLARRKECKGVSMGQVSQRCAKLDQKLVDVVVSYVRKSSSLVEPADKP